MTFKTMTAVSMFAFMILMPFCTTGAFARTAVGSAPTSVLGNVKSGLSKADEAMRSTADDIKAFFLGKSADSKLEPVVIRHDQTAQGLLGKGVQNTNGQTVAWVRDIIIDKNGKAALIVVGDGGGLGIGNKVAAFDYNKVVAQNSEGKTVMTLPQEMVNRAAFSAYEQKNWEKVKVIPAGSLSVNELLQGDVLDTTGKKVADIENVYFRPAGTSQLIVAFNKKFGFDGDIAALDYDGQQMMKRNQQIHFKLTPYQSSQFKNMKVSIAD